MEVLTMKKVKKVKKYVKPQLVKYGELQEITKAYTGSACSAAQGSCIAANG